MADNNGQASEAQQPKEKETCGIIMPIADTDSYIKGHWLQVKSILDESIEAAGFKPNIVSYANDTGVIHSRIIGNLFNNSVVVCDVSSRNPNVMFELGMRLAFDKAVVIVTDEITKFSFDTGVIEHLIYPADLNYHRINEFKQDLRTKIISTYEIYKNPDNPTFLKSFVQYKPKLEEKEISSTELILKKLDELEEQVKRQTAGVTVFPTFEYDYSEQLKNIGSDELLLTIHTLLRELTTNENLSKNDLRDEIIYRLTKVGYRRSISMMKEVERVLNTTPMILKD